ncbi:MAG TPA: hypothetical protein VL550_06580 [Rhodocyclaceae bacterium]|jgi:hypothetical protein|nr:hypothetical protein [Rhodocyclaceae bacterium]
MTYSGAEAYDRRDIFVTARRNTMAKSQLRGNKEAKKPKQDKKPVVPEAGFMSQTKTPPGKTKS